ncbi:hypothetical protein DSUL_100082 [Desulfovibrionales bacterium]
MKKSCYTMKLAKKTRSISIATIKLSPPRYKSYNVNNGLDLANASNTGRSQLAVSNLPAKARLQVNRCTLE